MCVLYNVPPYSFCKINATQLIIMRGLHCISFPRNDNMVIIRNVKRAAFRLKGTAVIKWSPTNIHDIHIDDPFKNHTLVLFKMTKSTSFGLFLNCFSSFFSAQLCLFSQVGFFFLIQQPNRHELPHLPSSDRRMTVEYLAGRLKLQKRRPTAKSRTTC